MKHLLFIFALFILCILNSACSSTAYILDSNPTDADVRIVTTNGKTVYTAKTPGKIPSKALPKKEEYVILLSKPGYKETTVLEGNSSNLKPKNLDLGKRTLEKSN